MVRGDAHQNLTPPLLPLVKWQHEMKCSPLSQEGVSWQSLGVTSVNTAKSKMDESQWWLHG